MFIRNDKSCSNCGKSRTFDLVFLSRIVGIAKDDRRVLGTLSCLTCDASIVFSIGEEETIRVVRRAAKLLPSPTSWLCYLKTDSSDAVTPGTQDWDSLVDWIVGTGLKKAHVEAALLDNPVLSDLAFAILIAYDTEEYNLDSTLVRIGESCFPVH